MIFLKHPRQRKKLKIKLSVDPMNYPKISIFQASRRVLLNQSRVTKSTIWIQCGILV